MIKAECFTQHFTGLISYQSDGTTQTSGARTAHLQDFWVPRRHRFMAIHLTVRMADDGV